MAEVVFESLQHASQEDLHAMAVYLRSLQGARAAARGTRGGPGGAQTRTTWLEIGAEQYAQHCSRCHGKNGEGSAAAVALAGNRAVTMRSSVNLVRVVLYGGYPPGTEGNPRPYGMPPFSHTLSDRQIGQVLSFIRSAWGNDAGPIAGNEVSVQRTGPLW